MKKLISIMLVLMLTFQLGMTASATEADAQESSSENATQNSQAAKEVASNGWQNWPEGPVAGAEAAIVMEVSTGAILYAKNIEKHLYPASITKILTALVAVENSEMDDPVKITEDCVSFLRWDEAQIGLKVGDEITMEQALYATLLASANEGAYAVGKNVAVNAGHDYDWFIDKMNEKVTELGGENSHFANTNGLHDENHYTCAKDMALIGRAIFQHPEIFKIMQTRNYTIPKSDTVDEIKFHQKHRMLKKGGSYYYKYAVGGKTGRTNAAGSTLVTMADNGEMQLVAVVMKAQGVEVYKDTKAMLDNAFENFSKEEIAKIDTSDNGGEIMSARDTLNRNGIVDNTGQVSGLAKNEEKEEETSENKIVRVHPTFTTTDGQTITDNSKVIDPTAEASKATGYVILPKDVSIEDLQVTEEPVKDSDEVVLTYSLDDHVLGRAIEEPTRQEIKDKSKSGTGAKSEKAEESSDSGVDISQILEEMESMFESLLKKIQK